MVALDNLQKVYSTFDSDYDTFSSWEMYQKYLLRFRNFEKYGE